MAVDRFIQQLFSDEQLSQNIVGIHKSVRLILQRFFLMQ